MKGFVGIIVTLAVFVAAILLMSTSTQTVQTISYNETLGETALFISNYELLLNQAAQDYNWEKTAAEIKVPIIRDSTKILTITKPPYTTCSDIGAGGMVEDNAASPTKFTFDLNCITEVASQSKTLFRNQFTKQITIKKYP